MHGREWIENDIQVHSPPASEASREVENLTRRKNPHTPVYGVKESILPVFAPKQQFLD